MDVATRGASPKGSFPRTEPFRIVQGNLIQSSWRLPVRALTHGDSPRRQSGIRDSHKSDFAVLDSALVDFKPESDHAIYLASLRRMSPQQRLARAFELSDNVRQLFRDGLRRRFPDLSEEELQQLYLNRLSLCHNRNY